MHVISVWEHGSLLLALLTDYEVPTVARVASIPPLPLVASATASSISSGSILESFLAIFRPLHEVSLLAFACAEADPVVSGEDGGDVAETAGDPVPRRRGENIFDGPAGEGNGSGRGKEPVSLAGRRIGALYGRSGMLSSIKDLSVAGDVGDMKA